MEELEWAKMTANFFPWRLEGPETRPAYPSNCASESPSICRHEEWDSPVPTGAPL